MNSARQPTPLKPGDTIGIAAPAGLPHDPADFHKGVALLQEMGFRVKFPCDGWQGSEFFWLAAEERQRAAELNRLWTDPEIAAIIALRGGFGSLQLLELLDWRAIAANPKLLIGFSDITVLLNVIASTTGQLCLHAPVTTSLSQTSPVALHWLQHCLVTGIGENIHQLPPLQPQALEVIQDGNTCSAPLAGGNLSSLITLLATPWDIDFTGKILLLEDVGEPLYRIDRMLTQLRLAGKLANLAGILLGDFRITNQSPEHDPLAHRRYLEQIWKLVITHCKKVENCCPIWANIPAGHCAENFALPIGTTVTMDAAGKELHFLPVR